MKRNLIKIGIVLLAGATFLTSCEKSDSTRNKRIIGEWTMTTQTTTSASNTNTITNNNVNDDEVTYVASSSDFSNIADGIYISESQSEWIREYDLQRVKSYDNDWDPEDWESCPTGEDDECEEDEYTNASRTEQKRAYVIIVFDDGTYQETSTITRVSYESKGEATGSNYDGNNLQAGSDWDTDNDYSEDKPDVTVTTGTWEWRGNIDDNGYISAGTMQGTVVTLEKDILTLSDSNSRTENDDESDEVEDMYYHYENDMKDGINTTITTYASTSTSSQVWTKSDDKKAGKVD